MKFVTATALVSLLSACGGASTGLDIPTFANALAVASASGGALERIDDLAPSARDQVLTSGSAEYTGTIFIGPEVDTPEVVGGMAIEVDFANNANINGGAGSFFDADGSAIDGTMTLSNAGIARGDTENRLTGDLQGRLSDVTVGDSEEDVTYDLALGGLFLGTNADAITGVVTGTADIAGSGATSDRVGTFVLERD